MLAQEHEAAQVRIAITEPIFQPHQCYISHERPKEEKSDALF